MNDNDITNSQLNHLINPEIKYDEFYLLLQKIAQEEDIQTVLEIGSSSGQGSTEALVTGLRHNPSKPKLFCMEVSVSRFGQLKKNYENESFVKCYNVSSISLDNFPDEQEVIDFYNSTPSYLNSFPLEQVLGYLKQDIDYVKQSKVFEYGIERIKHENKIDLFDLVLIDGSEFTGKAELDKVYGAKFICLDDVNTFKNYHNHQALLADPNYILVQENTYIRNGYSVFKRVREIDNYLTYHELPEQILISKIVQKGMLVFDIGANIGNYSILLSKLVGSTGSVYSFEPTSTIFNKLEERLTHFKCSNVYPFKKAVYSENTQIEFNEFPDDYSAWNSIGKPEMQDPDSGQPIPIIQTEVVEAVTLDSFCEQNNISEIDYLKIDVEGAESDVLSGAVNLLKNKQVRFIQFEISQKMLKGLNREAKFTFDILAEYGYECHWITQDGEIGSDVKGSNAFHKNYIAFPILPIHFFTIVLNGQPFIRYHINILKQLSFKCHWHIIEGIAELKHDTAWSLPSGGYISDEFHHKGRSNDGTTEYLDELVQQYPDNITVYRKPENVFWDGKREMVNEPLFNINEECLLWQIDVDELWKIDHIYSARNAFIQNHHKTAAFYYCWYFVGEKLVISTRNCYAHPPQEWLRTWRYKPGAVWVAHEPPILAEPLPNDEWQNIAGVDPFLPEDTENLGLAFQHFAYVTQEQLRFKEKYYGYSNAVSQWEALQKTTVFPVFLRDYFGWVRDETMVDTSDSHRIIPIAQRDISSNNWRFLNPEEIEQQITQLKKPAPIIMIDAVCFQFSQTGIGSIWKSLLAEWAKSTFAKHIIVIDRAGATPKIPGLKYRYITGYDYNDVSVDRKMLQQVCDEEGVDVFISSYYTTPITTPSVFFAYDMFPEVFNWNMSHPMWREKHYAIEQATAYIAISENTAQDLVKVFPDIQPESIFTAPSGINHQVFSPVSQENISQFKNKYGILKPYFLLVNAGSGYENSILFFQSFSQLINSYGFDIILVSSDGVVLPEFRTHTLGSIVQILQLTDEELAAAYSGAVALVYPFKYEAFGRPILEAMACGCPVITCPNASIPEIAGECAIYVKDDDVDGLADALCEIQKPRLRKSLIKAGREHVQNFSWTKMAESITSALIHTTLLSLHLTENNFIVFPDWSQPEDQVSSALAEVIRTLGTYLNNQKATLLINLSTIPYEDAQLLLASLTMSLIMEEGLDISTEIEISLVNNLADMQWEALLPRIRARIILADEDISTVAQIHVDKLPSYLLSGLSSQIQNFF